LRRFLIWTLVIIVVLYGAAEVAAKPYVEGKIEDNVKERYPVAREVDSSVSIPLLFGIITKSTVSRVEINVRHVDAEALPTDRVSATLEGVHIEVGESISRREIVVERVDRLLIVVEITDEGASKTLPEGFAFEFRPSTVIVSGPGLRAQVEPQVASKSQIRFVAQGQLPAAVRLPVWNLQDLPLMACNELDVDVDTGRLRITCAVDNPPIDFPPHGANIFALDPT
jgi:hypothetical protein